MPEPARAVSGGRSVVETPDHFRGWHFGKGTVRGAAGSNSI